MSTKATRARTARPDGEIAQEVLRKMKADLEVPDDRITVKVAHGIVTIAGMVNHASQRQAAEACAANVKGVRGVANEIGVEPAVSAVE